MNTVMAVIRVILTLVVVALACLCAWQLWSYYMQSPWTRDGRISADVVEVAPDVAGLVDQVVVKDNQEVKAGDKLVVLEAMKMLTTVSASADGVVKEVLVKKGDQVDSDDLLVRLE